MWHRDHLLGSMYRYTNNITSFSFLKCVIAVGFYPGFIHYNNNYVSKELQLSSVGISFARNYNI